MANRTALVTEADLKPCKIRKNFSGQKIASLSIVRYAGHHNKNAYYFCRCDCGREKIVRLSCIVGGINKTCGECPKQHASDSHAWKGCGEIGKDIWNTYRHGALSRGYEFSVTIEYLWNLFLEQDRKCAYTGWTLDFNKTYRSKTDRTASLDRIDSTLGYVEGNVQWVHRLVNKIKKNVGDELFIETCRAVARHRGGSDQSQTRGSISDVRADEKRSYLCK